MNTILNKISATLILFLVLTISCKDLEEMNINPNGVDPANASPNLLIATVITYTGQAVVSLGFGDIAGVMQHTQKDGWSGSHNGYEWTDQDWSGYYGTLRNTEELIKKSRGKGLDFQQAVGMIFKACNFGSIADLWGDAPYSKALLGELGGSNLKPEFDSQRDIYLGILSTLDSANILLSKDQSDYSEINPNQDILYNGDVSQWQKFANSLALRYYMRISSKEPEIARNGIEKIATHPDIYPLILDASDDAAYLYIGNSSSDSWPCNTAYDISETNYRRLKMCSTLVLKLEALNDPRLPVWANKVEIPIVVDPTKPDGYDEIVDGKRIIAQDVADAYSVKFTTVPAPPDTIPVNQDPNWVGMPPSWSLLPQAFNLCPDLQQAPYNPHCSHLNSMYKNTAGPLLKARILSAAEINFVLAEAALKGWSVGGTAETYYDAGVKASLEAWNLGDDYETYITNPGVSYNGTLEQIMEQKWIASWTAAAEAWFDYRRTGLPDLKPGKVVKREALPVRFYYGVDEMNFNPDNTQAAMNNLEETEYSSSDGKNSAWSKPWLLQGTGEPW
jgi:hypothetical protein